jgi:hypothetical protein
MIDMVNEISIGSTTYAIVHGGGYAAHLARPGEERSICGAFAPSDDVDAVAPTCRRCLAIATRLLKNTAEDDRIGLIAHLALDAVVEYGGAQVFGVPGDQVDALRRRLRSEFARRKLTGRTYVGNDVLFVHSAVAYEAIDPSIKAARARDALSRVSAKLFGDDSGPPLGEPDRGHRIDWDLWG